MKILFGTVIYEAAWQYRKEFAESINNQTELDFEVLIINDGINKKNVDKFRGGIQRKTNIISMNKKKTISEIRKILLLEAKRENADILVLGDFDDKFDENRISKIIKKIDDNTCFYYNNLKTFSDEIVFINLPSEVNLFNDILEYNFLGLSNTALNMKLISEDFIKALKNVETNVFDWYLFSKLLLEGKNGKLVSDIYTYYRIQENNIAGLNNSSAPNIQKEIMVKCCHYKLLQNENTIYEKLYYKYKELNLNNVELSQHKSEFWWSCINLLISNCETSSQS